MSESITRYEREEILDHLASQYVLGTLPVRVRKRVEGLCRTNLRLRQKIQYWQAHFSELDEAVPPLTPAATQWQGITEALFEPARDNDRRSSARQLMFYRWLSAGSLVIAVLFALALWLPTHRTDPLSYVAVMTGQAQSANLVATTYGDSRLLALEVIELPPLAENESFELWVKSKTDRQLRSLGTLPKDQTSWQRQLSEAQWRLIKDSHSLLLTREERGGSPIGEPMGEVVSSGLCVRLSMWEDKV
ncbi:anti-sigma factor [Bowmanella dokdonensis]|uniref:Anti-sigma factor n=1 Tax=Bowmanella dokdonensis TaxID=751969 RepID=A0A939DMC9_9ALTE|nr:anti-sigma factor [Bowmanella dokdonensis]MBN7825423.1 anti-sigma factor [Bowmanella dokdonensis]